ncbi:MAG: hypothetical protein IPN15_00600 [Saprospiraceae bacterium]|nr:hypothetical protein [Candidatus Vicinibacter affinis]
MVLTNFDIDKKDSIALNYKGQYLDLHNNFDFRSYHYDTSANCFELTWTRSHEDWANEKICGFKLVFREVRFLKFRERDNSLPLTEDTCLSDIGFLPPEMRDDFDIIISREANYKNDNNDDLNIVFQGGQGIKVNCTYADFIELTEEIIYVQIVNEPVPVWRPMWADRLEENVYRIKSFINYDPKDEFEALEFKSGEIVICELQKKADENIVTSMVAVRRK